MTRGKRLSDDLRAVVVRKYTEDNCRIFDIARSLKHPYSTIRGILTQWADTGTVSAQNLRVRGRPRILEYEDNQVCCDPFPYRHLTLFFLVYLRPSDEPE